MEMSSPEIIEVQEKIWTVLSSKKNMRYVVQLVDETCTCRLRCNFPGCKVCPEMYTCTCKNAVFTNVACKHVHLVHMKRSHSVGPNEKEVDSGDNESAPEEIQMGERALDILMEENRPDSREDLKNALRRKMLQLASGVETLSREEDMREVLSKASTLERFMASCQSHSQHHLPVVHSGPANRLMPIQPRLYCTRARREANSNPYTRPTSQQIADIQDKFLHFD